MPLLPVLAAMNFDKIYERTVHNLSRDPKDIARYEYFWNAAVREAAARCNEIARKRRDVSGETNTADLCAEVVMSLWKNPSI